jgi:hypothetical protein
MKTTNIAFMSFLLLILVFLSSYSHKKTNYLQTCWNKQVSSLAQNSVKYRYDEKLNELEHSFKPWQQTNYSGQGTVWYTQTNFHKKDTLNNLSNNRKYYSTTQYLKNELLFLDYGDKTLFPITKKINNDFIFKTARYSPILLIEYFYKNKAELSKESTNEFAIYKTNINASIVKLYINKNNNILSKISILSDDELFGDLLTNYIYDENINIDSFTYSKSITIEKNGGKIIDKVNILDAKIIIQSPSLIERPVDYSIKEDLNITPNIKTEKFNDNINFIELTHTESKSLVVEFKDFFFVSEAPLNSKNGELIINETKKISPNKPIKYFSFSHYHPHPLGGVRPFIQKGAKIICTDTNEEYLMYIAKCNHSINPDSLYLNPKPVLTEKIKDSLVISDGNYEMEIFLIGQKSDHTIDFLIYYFPKEKLLFESDLVWIPKEGSVGKAGSRQMGLYNAIKELKLDVKTIVQSWPTEGYGIKTTIPFEDLEKSINFKKQ